MLRGSGRTRWLLVVLVGVAAAACFAVAYTRRQNFEDIARPLVDATGPKRDLDVFSPFSVGHAYLWLGLGIGLTVTALVLLVGLRWRRMLFPWATGVLMCGALAGTAYAQIERDSGPAALRTGVYISVFGEENPQYYAPVFDPFNWRSPYLALGLAGGLLVGAGATALAANTRTTGPHSGVQA